MTLQMLTPQDRDALTALRASAQARGVVTDSERLAMQAGSAPAVGLDPRNHCKRPGFGVVFSIEEHVHPDRRAEIQRHMSLSLPTGEIPSKAFVYTVARALGFETKPELMPSPEVGWVITHAWEEIL